MEVIPKIQAREDDRSTWDCVYDLMSGWWHAADMPRRDLLVDLGDGSIQLRLGDGEGRLVSRILPMHMISDMIDPMSYGKALAADMKKLVKESKSYDSGATQGPTSLIVSRPQRNFLFTNVSEAK